MQARRFLSTLTRMAQVSHFDSIVKLPIPLNIPLS